MIDLLTEVEDFLAESGVAGSYFGRLAVNDGKFVDRLRRGGDVTTTTAAKVRQFMADWREKAGAAPAQPAE